MPRWESTMINMHRCVPLVLASFSLLCVAADWRQFRGPGGLGASDATDLPVTWSWSQGIAWKAALPGHGASSPIVVGDRVYLTCYNGYGLSQQDPGNKTALVRHIVCFDLASGRPVWDSPFPTDGDEHPFEGFQALHGFASSTLATDGTSLYFFFGRSGAGATSLDGKTRWRTSLGTGTHGWGSAASPVLYKDLVIFNACVESKSLVALNKATGDPVWRVPGIKSAWNTPLLVDVPGGSTELVLSMREELLAVDPRTGEKIWRCDGIQDYVCPSVIAHKGVVYAIGARRGTAIAVRAGGKGDVTETRRLWKINKGSNVSSPVYHAGHLFFVHESRGIAYCIDAETGRVAYERRLNPRSGRMYASPLLADGKIYYVTRDKGTYVLAARPEFELLAHNGPLDASIFNGSPAVAGSRLLIRSDEALYCLKK